MKIDKYKKNLDYTYALGGTLVLEALNNSSVIEIYFHPKIKESNHIDRIRMLANNQNINIIKSDKPFNILSKKSNCYVIAKIKKELKKIDDGNHIVLVNPSDAGNLGTIIRTALGFNFKNIAVIKDAVDAYDPKVIRASMGAIFNVNIEYFNSIEDYLKKFKNRHLYSFMLGANTYLPDVTVPKENFSLLFGNEATGLPINYAEFTTPILIPKTNYIDSFNLPIAVGIAMYKFSENKNMYF